MIEKFIGKPVTVQAILWDGNNIEEIKEFCNGLAHMSKGELYIETTEGSSKASINDYIVCGTEGEFYPVKPQVMRNKYSSVNFPCDYLIGVCACDNRPGCKAND